MKLQKATLFGLFAILELARQPGRQVSTGEIAEIYGISVNHLAKVMRDLGRAGLVEALRGVGGGYRFSGNAKRISLFDVIDLFGDIVTEGGELPSPSDETDIGLALGRVLHEIDEIAIATLKSITLATLIKSIDWQQAHQTAQNQASI
jgi:Rrf2 family protein